MGLAKSLTDEQSSFAFVPATDGSAVAPTGLGGFFAPEIILEGRKTRRVDVFSAGCLAFYLLTLGGHPFEMSGLRGQRDNNIIAGRYDLSRLNHLPEAKNLIESMIQFDPAHRYANKAPSNALLIYDPQYYNDGCVEAPSLPRYCDMKKITTCI